MRTTDEINAMTLPALQAAVAVDLLGWIEEQDDDPDHFISPWGEHCEQWEIRERVEQNYRDRHGEVHPGGWLGVVDDAMIARPEQWRPMHRFLQMFRGPRWFAGYVRASDGALICYEHADRETATLRAVLLALAAEAAAKGRNA